MNNLLENGHITEMVCGSNFAYILCDNNLFHSTEYKVLQSQTTTCFVKCMKQLYNGDIQLFYLTGNLKPFSAMIPNLDPDNFLTIVSNMLADIIDVKHNGFLSCQNIDISFDKIFVDPTTLKVSLVYLPVNKRVYSDALMFENELRTSLVKLISGVSTLSSPKTTQFSVDLSNGTLSIEDLYNRIKGNGSFGGRKTEPEPKPAPTPSSVTSMRLVAMNAPTRVEIEITKDEFVIGKKAELVDGVVSFNKMISRSHCKITRRNNQYSVIDLQSANGTYVNKTRLQPNKPCAINNGDVIRLANSDFQVVIG